MRVGGGACACACVKRGITVRGHEGHEGHVQAPAGRRASRFEHLETQSRRPGTPSEKGIPISQGRRRGGKRGFP